MAAPRVMASVKFVRNLGNFQSVHVDLGVEHDVEDGQSVKEALDLWFKRVEFAVQEKVQEIDAEAGKVNTVYHHKGH